MLANKVEFRWWEHLPSHQRRTIPKDPGARRTILKDSESRRTMLFDRDQKRPPEEIYNNVPEEVPDHEDWSLIESIKKSLANKEFVDSKEEEKVGSATGTVLPNTVASDFFDKIIPLPGLSRNIRLFFSLHRKPITKMLTLIEQKDSEAEADSFSFLGFSVLLYAAIMVFGWKKMDMGIKIDLAAAIPGLKLAHVDDTDSIPLIITVSLALITFLYAWLAYNIFNRIIKEEKSFRRFLKLLSLNQGMIIIYVGLLFLVLINTSPENENISIFLSLFSFIMIIYFGIVNLRTNKIFWGLKWIYFIPVLFILGIINNLILRLFIMMF